MTQTPLLVVLVVLVVLVLVVRETQAITPSHYAQGLVFEPTLCKKDPFACRHHMPDCTHASQTTAPPTSLLPRALNPLRLGSIRPTGWLQDQLTIQGNGASGHLDEIWPDIAQSQWIGGTMEGWERAPYWLDGFIPLAFHLRDDRLLHKAQRWVDEILKRQQPTGMLGPVHPRGNLGQGLCPANDSWPASVALKALVQYYEFTDDTRALNAIRKQLRFLNEYLDDYPLFSWGAYRWEELLLSVHWLFDLTGESWLLELGQKVHQQGYDWKQFFRSGLCKQRFNGTVCPDMLANHGVNVAMALKAYSAWGRQSKHSEDLTFVSEALEALDRYHGMPTGIFSADEQVAGRMPSQGSETCLVVEEMFSLEIALSVSGDMSLADRLERITFNAMPGSQTDDMWSHPYVQQVNEAISKFSVDRIYVSDGPESNMMGIAPNFGCCTANFNQGWPKFVSHLWMTPAAGGLAAILFAPSTVRTTIHGADVSAELRTSYPFEDQLFFTIHADPPTRFPFCVRIPSWASEASALVNANDKRTSLPIGALFCIEDVMWGKESTLTVKLPMHARFEHAFADSLVVLRGPLVFSAAVREEFVGVDEEKLLWEVHNASNWNYGVLADLHHPDTSVRFVSSPWPEGASPFSLDTCGLRATMKGRILPHWTLEHNAAAPPPQSPVSSSEPLVDIPFLPFGCTILRMTELPVLDH